MALIKVPVGAITIIVYLQQQLCERGFEFLRPYVHIGYKGGKWGGVHTLSTKGRTSINGT